MNYFMYYVYIIKSKKNNRLYVGLTDNLKKCFAEHNKGLSFHTKKYRPWVLVYYEAYTAYKDAEIREKRLKKFAKGYAQLKNRIINSINEA